LSFFSTLHQAYAYVSRYFVIILLFCMGGFLSYVTFIGINYYEEQDSQQQFQSKFKDKVTSLRQAASSVNKVFLATTAIFDTNKKVSEADFSRLISKDFLMNTGIHGVAWAPRISHAERASFITRIRASGRFDYQIRETSQNKCRYRREGDLFPVLFAEPADVIGDELGLRLNSECDIAEKMEKAVTSERITSVYLKNNQDDYEVRLFKPIFITADPKREKELKGYIVAIVLMNQVIDGLLADITHSENYQLQIYNGSDRKEKIYDSQWRSECLINCEPRKSFLSKSASIPFANQLWVVDFDQLNAQSHSQYYSYFAALLVFILTMSICTYLWGSINRVQWANNLIKQRTELLQYQATHDDLTELLNKQSLTSNLEVVVNKQNMSGREALGLLFIDLDHFKKVNDTKGHLVGDLLLKQVSDRLKKAARAEDIVFRFGGDEFAVLLHGTNCEQTLTSVAERILHSLHQVFIIEETKYNIGCSIGVSIWNAIDDNDVSVNELIRNADIAMYQAKNNGRGQVVFYREHMHKTIASEHDIESELAEAINNKQMQLYLQPIHAQGGLKGFEALCRWQHPSKGLIYPDEFISIAERTGLIHLLGTWLIEATCQQLAFWIGCFGVENCPYISINISPVQVDKKDIVKQINTELKQYNVPSKLLIVELTESALIGNKELVKQNLSFLRNLGVKVFLDDFGTGFSSLSLLHDYEIDTLKIDRSFIKGIETKKTGSQQLVKAIIHMAHILNMEVVAEGIESAKTLDWLNENNCNLMQGYYFSKPLSPENIGSYLEKHNKLEVSA